MKTAAAVLAVSHCLLVSQVHAQTSDADQRSQYEQELLSENDQPGAGPDLEERARSRGQLRPDRGQDWQAIEEGPGGPSGGERGRMDASPDNREREVPRDPQKASPFTGYGSPLGGGTGGGGDGGAGGF